MKKILLIEDNPDIRENTAEILELSNFEVEVAENGKVGIDKAKKIKPDLIICDIMMPELDGYGVLYALSKDNTTAGIPFIFLTAKTERSDIRKGMNLGADDYLTKPFDDVELLDAIESRLKKNEMLRKEFQKGLAGLDEFMETARGIEELHELSKDRKCKNYKKKEIIFFEGDYPNYLYFIHRGKVKTFKTNEEGKDYITGLHKEGDFFGYVPLLENSNHMESAMTMEDSEICLVPKNDFASLVYKNKEVSRKFIQILSQNVRETEDRLVRLAYNSVRKRVAESLLLLQDRYQNDNASQFKMSIPREDLANIVGTAKETVIRTLSDFKEEGLVQIKGSQIMIVDPEKLKKIKN